MSRHLFGLGPADYAMSVSGGALAVAPGAIGTVWNAMSAGTQYTDLQDVSTATITQVVADSNGRVGFYGPDGVAWCWLDCGFGDRFLMVATDLGTLVDGKLSLGGGTLTGALNLIGSTSTSAVLNGQVTGDSQQRVAVDASGKVSWGSGSAVSDVNLSRVSAGVLGTSGALQITGDLKTLGGTSTRRNKLSAVTPVSNTVTETVIAFMTIPANDAVIGAVYKIFAWGSFNTAAATPTSAIKGYLGGTAGTLLCSTGAITQGAASKVHIPWSVTLYLTCQGPLGASCVWFPHMTFPNVFASAATATPVSGVTLIEAGGDSVTVSSAASQDLALSYTWGTANGSNVLSCQGYHAERVA